MNAFKQIRADEVRPGDYVYGKGVVKTVENDGTSVGLVWPPAPLCTSECVQYFNPDVPVKILIEKR